MANNSEVIEKIWTLENLIHEDRVRQLRNVLNEYNDILLRYKEHGDYPHAMIIDTFRFEKPLTSIDISEVNPKSYDPEGIMKLLKITLNSISYKSRVESSF